MLELHSNRTTVCSDFKRGSCRSVSPRKILEKFFESNKHLSSIDHGREVVRGFVCYIYICDTPNFTGTKNVFVGSLLNILIFGFIYCILGIGTTRVAKLKLYRVRVRFLRAKKRRNEESPRIYILSLKCCILSLKKKRAKYQIF